MPPSEAWRRHGANWGPGCPHTRGRPAVLDLLRPDHARDERLVRDVVGALPLQVVLGARTHIAGDVLALAGGIGEVAPVGVGAVLELDPDAQHAEAEVRHGAVAARQPGVV